MDEKSIIKRLVQDYNKYSEMSVLLFEGSKLDMRDDPIISRIRGKRDLVMQYLKELTENNPRVQLFEHHGSLRFNSSGRKGEKLNDFTTSFPMVRVIFVNATDGKED